MSYCNNPNKFKTEVVWAKTVVGEPIITGAKKVLRATIIKNYEILWKKKSVHPIYKILKI